MVRYLFALHAANAGAVDHDRRQAPAHGCLGVKQLLMKHVVLTAVRAAAVAAVTAALVVDSVVVVANLQRLHVARIVALAAEPVLAAVGARARARGARARPFERRQRVNQRAHLDVGRIAGHVEFDQRQCVKLRKNECTQNR